MSLASSAWAEMEQVYGHSTASSSPCDYEPTGLQVYLAVDARATPETDVVASTRYPEE
jgi:hypothetical protein